MTPRLWAYAIGGAVLLAVLTAVGLTINHWRTEAARVPQLEQEIKDHEATIKREREEVQRVQAASQGFQEELARLRAARPVGPAPTVRVCRESPASGVLAPVAQPGSDAGSSAGGVLPTEPGPDIGPELYGAADRADELSAQIRGLHTYILEVCSAQEAGT